MRIIAANPGGSAVIEATDDELSVIALGLACVKAFGDGLDPKFKTLASAMLADVAPGSVGRQLDTLIASAR